MTRYEEILNQIDRIKNEPILLCGLAEWIGKNINETDAKMFYSYIDTYVSRCEPISHLAELCIISSPLDHSFLPYITSRQINKGFRFSLN